MRLPKRASSLRLRPAFEADVPRLIEIARRSWLSAFAETAPIPVIRAWAEMDREAEWYPKYWPSLTVAELDGVPVGLVQPSEDEVNGLWIHPAAQRCGVGSALLDRAEAQIRDAGYERAWLRCSGFNLRAQRFYAARRYVLLRSYTEVLPCGVTDEVRLLEKVVGRPRRRACGRRPADS